MEIDRRLVLQVGLSVAAFALFIAGLMFISGAYGAGEPVEDREMVGTIEGDVTDLTTEGEQTEGTFEGTVSADFDGQVSGELTGTLDGDQFVGEFDGTVSGAVDGTITGGVNGTLDEEAGTLEGEFDGTVDGTTDTAMDPDGALAIIALIAAFIILMPIFGYIIERFSDDKE